MSRIPDMAWMESDEVARARVVRDGHGARHRGAGSRQQVARRDERRDAAFARTPRGRDGDATAVTGHGRIASSSGSRRHVAQPGWELRRVEPLREQRVQ